MVDATPPPNVRELLAKFGKRGKCQTNVSPLQQESEIIEEGLKPCHEKIEQPFIEAKEVQPKSQHPSLQRNLTFIQDLNKKLEKGRPNSEPLHCLKPLLPSSKRPSKSRVPQRRCLPPLEMLGPAPGKPFRPSHLVENFKPLPKVPYEEEDELYADAGDFIPEYTEEEEKEDVLYDGVIGPPLPPSLRPLPPIISNKDNENDEEMFYNDVLPGEQIYEMPNFSRLSENEALKKDKSQKEQEKRMKQEQKKQEKKEKELDKIRKKFNVTGDLQPTSSAVIKDDSKGGKLDLAVIKGQKMQILNIDTCPEGKYLVMNDKGKIGFVEAANIEIFGKHLEKSGEESTYYEPQEDIYELAN